MSFSLSHPLRGRNTYLAANNSVDGHPVDGTVDETQVGGGVARLRRTSNVQVPVTSPGDHQVHILVVDFGVGGILDLDTEVGGDVVGEWCARDIASACGRQESR